MQTLLKGFGGALLAGALFTSAWTPIVDEIGEQASYTFSKPLLNGMGVNSLDDLRGRPVLVELWGTR